MHLKVRAEDLVGNGLIVVCKGRLKFSKELLVTSVGRVDRRISRL